MDVLNQIFSVFGVTWAKFTAQVVLFLIVYGILSKFAFGPIAAMLEERRRRLDEAQKNSEEIKRQLAAAESRYKQILAEANDKAQAMIDEARETGKALATQKQQDAIQEAERIIAKAKEATALEHERILSELKREVGRLVIETTSKVTGKVLTTDDQRRLSEETARQIST